jgi:hypothetical protein
MRHQREGECIHCVPLGDNCERCTEMNPPKPQPEPPAAVRQSAGLARVVHQSYVMAMAILQSPLYATADDELRQAVDDALIHLPRS